MIRPLAPALFAVLLASTASLAGCSGARDGSGQSDDRYSSNQATLLTFEFDGSLTGSGGFFNDATSLINDQMLYTIGHLNGDRSVGRLDAVELTNVQSTTDASGTLHVTYHAKLPVSWGSRTNLPTGYDFTLPSNVSYDGQQAFTTRYMSSCVDFGAHDVDAGSMWYYFRPSKVGCTLADSDVVHLHATVTVSPENTNGKYPEYDKVWEDNELHIVSIFGKFEEGATTDVGIDGFNNFVSAVSSNLRNYGLTTTPSNATGASQQNDVTLSATLPDGKKVVVTALLVEKITSAPESFWQRYESLSASADMIAYNGHAGLGQNVRALAQRGTWVQGKYVIIFMNGCDTFAYVDGSLAATRAKINPDDPTGTKYMEFVTNSMPSFFSSMPYASMALVRGLLGYNQPKTYQEIFKDIDNNEVVLVTGEEDNTFVPGKPIDPQGGNSGDAGSNGTNDSDAGTDDASAPPVHP